MPSPDLPTYLVTLVTTIATSHFPMTLNCELVAYPSSSRMSAKVVLNHPLCSWMFFRPSSASGTCIFIAIFYRTLLVVQSFELQN